MKRYCVDTFGPDDPGHSCPRWYIFDTRRGRTSFPRDSFDANRAVAICHDPEIADRIAAMLNEEEEQHA